MPDTLWEEYSKGKQTYAQLATQYGCSARTIQRHLDKVKPERASCFAAAVNVLMDTTYFSRSFGVMVFKDSISGQILYKCYVKTETNKLYYAGIEEIARRGISVQAVICDGRKGLFQAFSGIPVQMCQFHQMQIITRYLTRRPKTPAAIALQEVVKHLTRQSKAAFTAALEDWYNGWQGFLNERAVSPLTGKSHYMHRRLRSAYRSLIRNLPWLFTFEEHKELMIPNTTNALDGLFAALKTKLRNHNGLSLDRKKKFIDGFFKA